MENTYKTSDKNLACFLNAKGLVFKKIESSWDTNRCNFVLSIPEWINLIDLLTEWSSSDSDFYRTLLYKNKQLAKELSDFFRINKSEPFLDIKKTV